MLCHVDEALHDSLGDDRSRWVVARNIVEAARLARYVLVRNQVI